MTSLATRLSALHAASFLTLGVYLPFFPVWLQSRGLEPSAIGLILAVPLAVRVVATAPLVSLADGPLGARRVLLASHAAHTLAFAALLAASSPLAIGVVVAATAVAQAPIMSLNDLVTMQAVRERPSLDYGGIRVWGSVAFLVTSVGAGAVLASADPNVIVLLLAGLPLLGILATLRALPRDPARPAQPDGADGRPPVPIATGLWLVMAAAACIQSSHAAMYAFGSLHWRTLGYSDPTIGTLWAFAVVVEIALFALLGRIARTPAGALRLLGVGAAAAAIRWLGLAAATSLPLAFALQTLHAFSFAATHIGVIALVSALAPEGGRGRAQGWLGTTVASATALATVASGPIYRAAGPLVFAAMAPLALAGLVLTIAAARRTAGRPGRP